MNTYSKEVIKLIERVVHCEANKLTAASEIIKSTVENDGLIYVFGCGHSHIFGEELFYRAGGLANVRPILYEPLMLHKGAMQSSVNEKKNDYINHFINEYSMSSNDTLIVISTSGINPVPIDVARAGEEMGAKVITISSHIYTVKEQSRHKDGLYLRDMGLVNIDNYVPTGDAVCKTNELLHTPVSTVVGITILQTMISEAIDNCVMEEVPVFKSGNVSGSKEHNENLVRNFGDRVPMLINNLD